MMLIAGMDDEDGKSNFEGPAVAPGPAGAAVLPVPVVDCGAGDGGATSSGGGTDANAAAELDPLCCHAKA